MEIYSVPVPKAKLDKIPQIERAFYIHVLHVRNEVGVLIKLLSWSMNNASDNPVLINVDLSQQLMFIRLLAGKVWEGWELVRKAFFATKLSIAIEGKIPDEAKKALDELKKYFGKSNIISVLRNEFAFHYAPERIKDQLSLVDDTDQLEIYVTEKSGNMFYLASETIVNSAMLEAIGPGDSKAAVIKLGEQVTSVSFKFMSFCDGCWEFMMDNYLGKNATELDSQKIEVSDVQERSEIRLPFFFA